MRDQKKKKKASKSKTNRPDKQGVPVGARIRAPADKITMLPLGGVGAIGMNNMLIGCDGHWLMLDSGVMFPDKASPGVDLVLPCLDVLDRLEGEFHGVVLTHGHEDHIGSLPFVRMRHDVRIWGTAFTLGLVRARFAEHKLDISCLRETTPGKQLQLGPFTIDFLRVTHSIPDCVSLAIRTPVGNVLFTGDFKIDHGLPCGTRFDEAGYRAFGKEGVLLMMADSTNIQRPGRTVSEAEVAIGLRDAMAEAPGRVFIGLFSSNLYRLHGVLAAARETGRKVCLLGRSLHKYLEVATEWGGNLDFSGPLISDSAIGNYADHELLFVCTGTQGEPRAALGRIAAGAHRVKIHEDDTLILSARAIPGNLREIHQMIDGFTRAGAHVFHRDAPWPIHASGHAAHDELEDVLRWVKPKIFAPVHGTRTFLEDHADLGEDCGIERVCVFENGDVLQVDQKGAHVVDQIELTPWYYDGMHSGTRDTLGVRQRVDLARDGAISVCVAIGDAPTQVHLDTRGVYTDGGRLVQKLEAALVPYIDRLDILDHEGLQEEVRLFTRRFFKRETGKKPQVMATLFRTSGAA